jgi:hypothetical protein
MRDEYPLAPVRIENILVLVNGEAIAEATALLPITLCLSAVRPDATPRDSRSHLLRISFFLVWNTREMRDHEIDRKPENMEKGHVTVFTSQWTVRFLNTVVSLISRVEKYTRLALDRLGTHQKENFLVFLRWDSNDIDTSDQMVLATTNTNIVKDANRDLGEEEQIKKRVNLRGVHYDEQYPNAKLSGSECRQDSAGKQ